ncbi:ATP-binding cassette sub-family G member 8-like [Ctenocephalides felis]|uniref:ATP-binding cassette sub-family G member 8-like n=1 Tax=Ctenocephalides felis TaxID=7515 RepID=UPI000E6E49FB|nr:ATP-binding cassette sub-family G member 8-like [Ctenocephalides felis]
MLYTERHMIFKYAYKDIIILENVMRKKHETTIWYTVGSVAAASSRVSVAMGQGHSPNRHNGSQGGGLRNYRSLYASEANFYHLHIHTIQTEGVHCRRWNPSGDIDYVKSRKAESIISGTQAPSVKDYSHSVMMSTGMPYPNIQFLNLEVSCSPVSIIGVSLQARAGDLVAVMATVEEQGSCLLETIAGVRKKLAGDALLNGQHVNMRALRRRISWAPRRESLHPYNSHLTVYTTLKFYSQLKYPQRGKSDMTDRISILIEELGLEQVKDMTVCRLTDSETQRLTVACQLLQDTAILVLDQPTKGMDIFDTFFLIEYLRQYAANGRIVILSLQPPTYEIFLMCSGILLLSSGRVMYSGSRIGFVEHFSNVGYPCPMYKNPSDYYLDLVTLDDLSAAAMLESSGRIESLAEMWASQGLPNLTYFQILPALLRKDVKPNAFMQAIILLKLFLVYSQPNTIVSWVFRLFLSIVMSLAIGAIFWDLPSSDPQLNLNDRIGYHYAVSAVCIWPILLCAIYRDMKNIKSVERDVRMGMYGRFTYIFVKVKYNKHL